MRAPTRLPVQVSASHDGWRATFVQGDYHIATWRLDPPDGHSRFVKVTSRGMYPTLEMERDRLAWCARRIRVPEVVDHGHDAGLEWLILEALPGRDATHFTGDPERVVPIFARGLRRFHEANAEDCPFDFRLDAALEHCRRRVGGDGVPRSQGDFHEEYAYFTPATAFEWLEHNRPDDEDVVLCHGDYCFPNVLVEDDEVTGYLDLGEMGLADRWWDLAVGTWTCDWNVGPGYQDLFLESYGIERDQERINYYRVLYDLAS